MEIITERVDDIPLLTAEFEKSELAEKLNQCFPDHGNWKGIDGGKITVGFLTYILSCGDHRLSSVEEWVSERINTLRHCLKAPELTSKDFTDDKLGLLLDRYSDASQWSEFEFALNKSLINVYNLDLKDEAIRVDAMNTQSFRSPEGDFQIGHAKQHRADLPQIKSMIAVWDPLAMPIHSLIASGNTSDDVMYMPVIKDLIKHMELKYQLFVGDTKMGSQETRCEIQESKNYYLMPLSQKQCSQAQLAEYLKKKPEVLVEVKTEDKKGKIHLRAQAFEEHQTMEVHGIKWEERRIVVYSPAYAKTQTTAFEKRLDKAQSELEDILTAKQGRKKLDTLAEVQTAVDNILTKQEVSDLVEVKIIEQTTTKEVRKYGNRPQENRPSTQFSLEITVDEAKKDQQLQLLGWRPYACNAPAERLNTTQVVECYRDQYQVEHKFNELLNKVTALMPVFLQKENRIKALIRLLLLALKYVSLVQYQVRKELKATKQSVKELFEGNPSRATNKPTTNLMLNAFRNITLVFVLLNGKSFVKITGLKPVHLQILNLLKLSPEVYLDLEKLFFSPPDFSET